MGPHARGNAARHGVDPPDVKGRGRQKAVKRPPQQPARPPVRQLLGPADAETTPQGAPAAAAVRTH